jgi:hypothetical protein
MTDYVVPESSGTSKFDELREECARSEDLADRLQELTKEVRRRTEVVRITFP